MHFHRNFQVSFVILHRAGKIVKNRRRVNSLLPKIPLWNWKFSKKWSELLEVWMSNKPILVTLQCFCTCCPSPSNSGSKADTIWPSVSCRFFHENAKHCRFSFWIVQILRQYERKWMFITQKRTTRMRHMKGF